MPIFCPDFIFSSFLTNAFSKCAYVILYPSSVIYLMQFPYVSDVKTSKTVPFLTATTLLPFSAPISIPLWNFFLFKIGFILSPNKDVIIPFSNGLSHFPFEIFIFFLVFPNLLPFF